MARESVPSAEEFSEEFERLKAATSTKPGYDRINDEWMHALNYEKRGGVGWFKVDHSAGSAVAGFAIDPVTWEHEIGPYGYHHQMAKQNLGERIADASNGQELSFEIKPRLVEGLLGRLRDWKFPLAFVYGWFEPKKLIQIESKILEKRIGLPIRGIGEKMRGEDE